MNRTLSNAASFLVLLLVTTFSAAGAQSSLDTAEATDFLGSWAITLQSPDGDVPLVVEVTDLDGKIGMRVGDGQEGLDISEVSRSGEDLVARYAMSYQGMEIPVIVRLRKDGESIQTDWEFADGMYVTSAVGRRQ